MKHILIVDDSPLNLLMAKRALEKEFKVSTVQSGEAAIEFLKTEMADMILLDIEMPGMNGIEALQRLKIDQRLAGIPVIFLTSMAEAEVEEKCLKLGAADFITKPFHAAVMVQRMRRALELDDLQKNLEGKVIEKTKEVENLTVQTITTFANSIDAKDSYTKSHSYHVAKYAEQIGRILGLGELEVKNLYYAALLHDIGKIGIPDFILNKPGALTEEEYQIIKRHPEIGGRILKDVTVVPHLGEGASNHHERFDGTGYPNGKSGEHIPMVGRIVGIADAVDAMISDRAYRPGRSVSEVIAELKRCSGTQFDPLLVEVMCTILEKGIVIPEQSLEIEDHNKLLENVMNEYAKLSQIDALTGFWNRSYMEEGVNRSIECSSGAGAMLMLDIHHFKEESVSYAQRTGKSLLQAIAEILDAMEEEKLSCRLGGDEFLIYFPKIEDRMQVENWIRKLQWQIQEEVQEPGIAPITVFMGAAMMPGDGRSFLSLYHKAEKSIFYLKKNRTGCFCFYSEELVESSFAEG